MYLVQFVMVCILVMSDGHIWGVFMCMSDGGIGNQTGAWIPRDQVYTQIEIDDHFLFYAHQAGGLKLYNKFSSIIIFVVVDLIVNINAILRLVMDQWQ